IELDGAPEFSLRSREVIIVILNRPGQRVVPFRCVGTDLDRTQRQLSCPAAPFHGRRYAVPAEEVVTIGETRMCSGESRITGDSVLEQSDRAPKTLWCALRPVMATAQPGVIRLRIDELRASELHLLVRRQFNLNLTHDGLRRIR